MSYPDIRIKQGPEGLSPSNRDSEYARDIEQKFLVHYGLNEQPFGVTPDTRFLYFGSQHRQALAALSYGTDSNRGFMTLIAKPGMGKTSLLFQYLTALGDKPRTAFVFQTDGDSRDLMYYLLTDLGISCAGKDLPEMRTILNQLLLEDMKVDRPFVLVIDEAQNLDEKALESVRLLSNFERPWMKLIQIVLAGQPQLAEKLARPSMAQFQQRVSFSIRIEPFDRGEVDAYIDHRLRVAGYVGPSLFDVAARALLAERSEGIPRIINNICFYAMSLGWATNRKAIDREMISDVLEDLDWGSSPEKPKPAPPVTEDTNQSIPEAARPDSPGITETIPTVSQPIRLAGLTSPEPPDHSWLIKVVIVSVALIALIWGCIYFDAVRRLEPFWHSVATGVKSAVVARPALQTDGEKIPPGELLLDFLAPNADRRN